MNQVKTYIDKSGIEGIGLFAAEFIPKGTLIWKLSGLDQEVTNEKVKELRLSDVENHYYLRYSWGKGVIIFCCDDAKYCNHSDNANTCGCHEQYALRDIEIGEEITCNYVEIHDDFDFKEFETLKSYR